MAMAEAYGVHGNGPSSGVVCIVDDDSSVRKSICHLLESGGFSVHAFANSDVFLEHLAGNAVPVVVLDICLDQMTAMDLLTKLGARSPETRVIFITGFEDAAVERFVRQSGVFDFFKKPFDGDKLLNSVRLALRPNSNGAPNGT
jgi:FixJ family two-component response regulator